MRKGMRIAQMIFFEVGEILGRDYTQTGKYQSETDLKKMKKNWRPEMVLPRLHHDREIKNRK